MPLVLLPRGIYCPTCKGTDLTRCGGRKPMAGLRVRYFFCNTCETGFKSDERLGKVTKPPWNGRKRSAP